MESLLGGLVKLPSAPGEIAGAFETGVRGYNSMASAAIDRQYMPMEKELALASSRTRLRGDNLNITVQQTNMVREALQAVPRLAKDANETYNDVCVKKIERCYLPQMLAAKMSDQAASARSKSIQETRELMVMQQDFYKAFSLRRYPCCGRLMGNAMHPVRKLYYHPRMGLCYRDHMPRPKTLKELPCDICEERIKRNNQRTGGNNGGNNGGGNNKQRGGGNNGGGGGGGNGGGGNNNQRGSGNNGGGGGGNGGGGGGNGGGGNNNNQRSGGNSNNGGGGGGGDSQRSCSGNTDGGGGNNTQRSDGGCNNGGGGGVADNNQRPNGNNACGGGNGGGDGGNDGAKKSECQNNDGAAGNVPNDGNGGTTDNNQRPNGNNSSGGGNGGDDGGNDGAKKSECQNNDGAAGNVANQKKALLTGQLPVPKNTVGDVRVDMSLDNKTLNAYREWVKWVYDQVTAKKFAVCGDSGDVRLNVSIEALNSFTQWAEWGNAKVKVMPTRLELCDGGRATVTISVTAYNLFTKWAEWVRVKVIPLTLKRRGHDLFSIDISEEAQTAFQAWHATRPDKNPPTEEAGKP